MVLIFTILLWILSAGMYELFWRLVVANILKGMVQAELIPASLSGEQLLLILLFTNTRAIVTGVLKALIKDRN